MEESGVFLWSTDERVVIVYLVGFIGENSKAGVRDKREQE